MLSDVSAFLVDGDYHWSKTSLDVAAGQTKNDSFLQVIEKCGIVVNFQQVFINRCFISKLKKKIILDFFFNSYLSHID